MGKLAQAVEILRGGTVEKDENGDTQVRGSDGIVKK